MARARYNYWVYLDLDTVRTKVFALGVERGYMGENMIQWAKDNNAQIVAGPFATEVAAQISRVTLNKFRDTITKLQPVTFAELFSIGKPLARSASAVNGPTKAPM